MLAPRLPGFMRLCIVVALVLSCFAPRGNAAPSMALIPPIAARGARVVVAGTGLDAAAIAVTFTASGAASGAATIVQRTATLAEVIVPPSAVSGPVKVTSGTSSLATLSFTLAPDPSFGRVVTLAGAPPPGGGDDENAPKKATLFNAPLGVAISPGTARCSWQTPGIIRSARSAPRMS
jgi:hypothetical protein